MLIIINFCSQDLFFFQELQDVPNGDLKAESDVLPAKEVAVDGHAKSE